jgi:hypothetical protein
MDWDRGAVSGAKSIAGSMGLSDRSGIDRNSDAGPQVVFSGRSLDWADDVSADPAYRAGGRIIPPAHLPTRTQTNRANQIMVN